MRSASSKVRVVWAASPKGRWKGMSTNSAHDSVSWTRVRRSREHGRSSYGHHWEWAGVHKWASKRIDALDIHAIMHMVPPTRLDRFGGSQVRPLIRKGERGKKGGLHIPDWWPYQWTCKNYPEAMINELHSRIIKFITHMEIWQSCNKYVVQNKSIKYKNNIRHSNT